MAALPYMQLYVADYLADTAHLSTVEHGAYLLLIFNYWQRGESFKAKDEQSLNKRLTSVTRTSNEEWQQIKNVLSEFFVVTETEWSHERIERDLDAVNAKSAKARNAGKASGVARSSAKKPEINDANECSTNAHRTLNHTDTDTDTNTDTDTEVKKKHTPKGGLFVGVSDQVVSDFKAMRSKQRAPITKTAILGITREADIAGISLEAALTICCERNWRGFKAEWVRDKPSDRGSPVIPLEARNKAVGDKWVPPEMRAQA